MKLLLIIGFLWIGIFGFGQSKKEVNKQLRAEYSILTSKVDSLLELYNDENALKYEILRGFEERTDLMYENQDLYMRLTGDLGNSLTKLEQLGVNSVDRVSRSFLDSMLLLDRVDFITQLVREKQGFTEFFGFSKYELTDLDERSIKEQNEFLPIVNKQRDTEIKVLTQEIEETIAYQTALLTANSRYNSMEQFMKQYTSVLIGMQVRLNEELKQQRELYAKKGPKGFPEAYAKVFPGVFSADNQELVYKSDDQEMNKMETTPIIERAIVVDEPAEFPGGKYAMLAFMKKYLHYPEVAKELGLEGKCDLQFVVLATGKISNVKVTKGIPYCSECDQEAARMVRSMPQWAPGKIDGVSVDSVYELTVVFKVDR